MIRFRPLLWPTVIALPMLAVLIALGLWQLDRREWKLGLMAEIEERLAAPEAALADLPAGASVAYRRAAATGRFDHAKEVFWLAPGPGGEPGYHVITPLLREEGPALLVDRGFIPQALKDPSTRAPAQSPGEVTIRGILRESQAAGFATPQADWPKRLVYVRNVAEIARGLSVDPVLPYFLEADATPNPGGYPLGGQTKVVLRNPHLSYAVTWFGLAAALVMVYLLYHRSRGRLGEP